jgi:hypothetical protein
MYFGRNGAKEKKAFPSILESDATGKVAEIYADIRQVLGTSIAHRSTP